MWGVMDAGHSLDSHILFIGMKFQVSVGCTTSVQWCQIEMWSFG